MIPNMLELAQNSNILRTSRFPENFWKNFWTIGILKFWAQNQVQWQKLSGKNTQYIEIGQNQPIPGHFWISGCLESRIKNLPGGSKSVKNWYKYVIVIIFIVMYWKNTRFWTFSLEVPKSAVEPRPIIPKSTQLN